MSRLIPREPKQKPPKTLCLRCGKALSVGAKVIEGVRYWYLPDNCRRCLMQRRYGVRVIT